MLQITLMGIPGDVTPVMRYSGTPRREATATHDPERLLATSLAVTLAMPALILAIASPTLAVAFAVGLLSASAAPDSPALLERVSSVSAGLRTRQAPAN